MDNDLLFGKKSVQKQEETYEKITELEAFENGMEDVSEAELRYGGMKHKDGKKMLEVKEQMQKVSDELGNLVQADYIKISLNIMVSSFDQLIDSCKNFTSDVFLTASGKRRKAFVQVLEKRAEALKGTLLERGKWAAEKLENKKKPMTWYRILQEAGLHIVKCDNVNILEVPLRKSDGNFEDDKSIICKDQTKYFYEKELKLTKPNLEAVMSLDSLDLTGNIKENIIKIKNAYSKEPQKVIRFCVNINKLIVSQKEEKDYLTILQKLITANSAAKDFGIQLKNKNEVKQFCDVLPNFQERLLEFVQKNKEFDNLIINGMKEGESITIRKVLEFRMANLLNLNRQEDTKIISPSQSIMLVSDKKDHEKGVITSYTESRYNWRKEDTKDYSQEFIKDLCNLQLFDAIIGCPPRNIEQVAFHEKSIDGKSMYHSITAIPQNVSFSAVETVASEHGLVNDNKFIMPYIDEEMFNQIKTLLEVSVKLSGDWSEKILLLRNEQKAVFKLLFGDYLTDFETDSLILRIHDLYTQINKAIDDGTTVKVREFTETMVKEIMLNEKSYVAAALKDINENILLEKLQKEQKQDKEQDQADGFEDGEDSQDFMDFVGGGYVG